MRAVDTNVLVRLLVQDNEAQVAEAERFLGSGAWVSTVVLAETIWALESVYELDAMAVATAVGMLLGHEKVSLEASDAVVEAVRVFREKPGLGFSDCLILHLAKRAGHTPLGTFDTKLGRLDGALKI
ncbi:MAG: type II toxin-antitoxin system VapC family toxin [Acidobacteria bacterium]|nr:type II toxin-antitoxin system VapC family toxin [Acidobacteriota bacterium]